MDLDINTENLSPDELAEKCREMERLLQEKQSKIKNVNQSITLQEKLIQEKYEILEQKTVDREKTVRVKPVILSLATAQQNLAKLQQKQNELNDKMHQNKTRSNQDTAAQVQALIDETQSLRDQYERNAVQNKLFIQEIAEDFKLYEQEKHLEKENEEQDVLFSEIDRLQIEVARMQTELSGDGEGEGDAEIAVIDARDDAHVHSVNNYSQILGIFEKNL